MPAKSRVAALFATLAFLSFGGEEAAGRDNVDPLLDGFINPPQSAKSHVWWHWMNGNVSKQGITADLEAMAKAGIGGAQIFDVSDGIPPGPVAFNSDKWFEMLRHANSEAKRLGLELCLANCSGWSSSGGPWVPPEDAEKNLVFAETLVRGGCEFNGVLPCATNQFGFYRDLKVLAFPRPTAEAIQPRDYGAVSRVNPDGKAAEIAFARPFPLTGVALEFDTAGRHHHAKVFLRAKRQDGKPVDAVETTVYPVRYGFKDDRIFVPLVVPDAKGVELTCELSKGARLAAVQPIACGRIAEERAKTLVIRSRLVNMVNPLDGNWNAYFVDPRRIADLTPLVSADGQLRWTAPSDAAEWVILRMGFAANGARCRPPTPAGDGLEVDKFSKPALGRFFANGYVDRALRELGPVDPRGGLHALIVDSYEVQSQNWTDGLEAIFAKRKGYDLTRFLPAFTGRLVGSVRQTDEFLADFRAVLGSLFVENYAAEFHRLCRMRGLDFYLEGYGSAPCSDLRYARHCDVPMGEFWARGNLLTGNCRFAASVAHVWGHRVVASESFTTAETGRWSRDPFAYKAQGDRAYCAGINRLIYHRWAHQPWTNPANYPGMTMGPHGSHFERTQTWWADAAPALLKYQARCQWLLQQGVAASDLLVVAEDKTPSCGLDLSRWHEYESVDPDRFGRGIQWDLCDVEAETHFRREQGRTIVPSGAAYQAVIRLPNEQPPRIEPDVELVGEDVSRLRWIHRRTSTGDEIYFVAMPNETQLSFEVSFRQTGRQPEIWDPETGTVRAPRKWREQARRTQLTLDFKPSGSAFVLFRARPTAGLAAAKSIGKVLSEQVIEGSWKVEFANGLSGSFSFPKLIPWNEHENPDVRYYSGSARYAKSVPTPELTKGNRLWLDLGEVKNVAVVMVNGKQYPVLWRPPFCMDITDALENERKTLDISVKVTNLWPNRLIGDDRLSCDAEYRNGGIVAIPDRVWRGEKSPTGRQTFTTWRLWKKDEPLLPSGLLGPVKLIRKE